MKLLLTGAFNYSEKQIDKIKKIGYDVIFVQDERIPLEIDPTDIEAVVCNSLFIHNDISKFKKLRTIQLTSAGSDRVPLEYIRKNKIELFTANDVYSIPIAEWVVLKILEIYKKSRFFYEAESNHNWIKQRDLQELTNKTAVIIGFGNIGVEIAKRLRPFGVKIIGVSRKQCESDLVDEYYVINELDNVLKKSDIAIITLPITDETYKLIDSIKIENMKDRCVLVNVSRGQVIDEIALTKAIYKGKFLGVALDVFDIEPLPKESPLWDMDSTVITPHNSFVSDQNSDRLFELIYKNIRY